MKIRTSSILAALGVGIIGFSATQSIAGEVLKLKSGAIALSDQTQTFLKPGVMNQQDGLFVIQFKNPITQKDQDGLASAGIEVLRYLPDDAFLVRASARQVGVTGMAFSSVHAVSAWRPEWKMSPEFADRSSRSAETRVLVMFATSDELVLAAPRLKSMEGVRPLAASGRTITADATPAGIAALATLSAVEWIEEMPILVTWDLPVALDDSIAPVAYTGYESGTRIMNFDAAWSRGYSGEGQIVAMADTGVDTGDMKALHRDLGGVFVGHALGFGSKSWEDPQAHGTHVCGSVVGTGYMSGGEIRGGAYDAKMSASGLWSPIMNNLAFPTDFNKLFGPAYDDGARIHTNSWGSPNDLGAYNTMAAGADEYMWNHPDLLILFAAGNSGEDKNRDGRIDENSIGSPATAKNVLSVGASENLYSAGGIQKKLYELRDGETKWGVEPIRSDKLSDNPKGIAAFSSRGPTTDGRLKPEIVAPGTNIVSTRSHHKNATQLWGAFDAEYLYAGGTSMATPLTAAAATVAREYLIKNRKIAAPSAALLKGYLMHTAKDLFPGQYGTGSKQELPVKRPNVHEGYGRVDMDALTSAGNETVFVDDSIGVGLSQEKVTVVSVAQGRGLRATLTYTDAPGSTSASKALVNDLDLKIVAPNGKAYTLNDHLNNSEMLELSALDAGDYRVVVVGANVPQGKAGKQPFALVVSQL